MASKIGFQAEIAASLKQMRAVIDLADGEKRNLTAGESKTFGELETHCKNMRRKIIASEEGIEMERNIADAETIEGDYTGPGSNRALTPRAERWQDTRTGREIRLLSRKERLCENRDLSIGKLILGLAVGRWEGADAEKRAMAEGTNFSGGYLVPDALSATVIDLARSKSVCIAAGARTIPMESETLNLARLTADVVVEQKGENASFSGSQPTFDSILLSALTWGQVVFASRELLQDAANASSVIENSLSSAMGLAIDNLCLNGGASGRPMGIALHPDVGETATVGSPLWEDILLGIKGIENNNGMPTGYVLSPATKYSYAVLVTGDGTNSSKDWLRPPPDIATLQRFVTKGCPDSKLFIGDFSQMLIGVRSGIEIQTSPVAGDAFAKNQIAIRVVWRGDVVFAHANHFFRLVGIT